MATQRKVEFQGTFNIQEILSAVDALQNRLNRIQLDDSSARRFERTFADLKKRAQEIDAEIKQGFTNTSQINNFNNHLQKLGQQMEILKGEIGRIDTSFSNLQLSPNLQKQFENLKNSANTMFDAYENQISSIENKISSFANKTGVSFDQTEISGLAEAISSSEKLAKLQEEKQASLQQERADIQATISAREESLKQAEQEVILARQNQEMIAAQLVAQKEKITSMRGEGADTASLQKQIDIQKDLTAKNNEAREAVLKKEKAQEEIVKNLKSEQAELTKIESSLSNITKFFNGLKGDSSGLDDDAAAAAKEFADLSGKVAQLEKQLEAANAELQKFKDLQSEAANVDLGKSKKDIDNLGLSLEKASEETGTMGENLVNLSKQDQFFDNLKNRATAVFGLTNAFIYMNRFIRESVNAIKELDAAFTEIAVVTDMTTTQLWESFDIYNEMAQKLGTTTVDAIQTSALYYQQGLDTVEVLQLTEETMKMARIAGMDYAEATDRMTAALRGFKLEMSEASRVNDVFSALAAESAVDTDELSYALTKTASIAQSAGMELETTSAFLSQMIETTREAPENIGTAMKTIIARFQELKSAVGDSVEIDGELVDVNKVDTALKSVGVQLRDSLTGQFRDLDDVFLELASKWDTLDRNTQRYVATIAAGSRQQSRFIAMMDNYERTLELVDIAQNSNGASAAQFAKTLDSLEAKMNNIKSSFEEFIGTVVGSELVKDILDGVNTILQMINNIAEAGPAAIAVFGTFFIMTIKKIISNFINTAKVASTAFTAAWTTVSGNYSTKMKDANQQAVVDLENRIRNSIMDKILADKIKNGVNAGVNNTPLNGNTANTTNQQSSNSMNWGNLNKKEIKSIIAEYEKTSKISQDSRIKLNQAGVLNPQQQLFAKPGDIAESAKAYQKANGALATFTKKIGNLNPLIGQTIASFANIGTMAIMGNAATKGTAALGGATAGNMVGSLVGSLGYLIPGAGMILGPIFQALGGTLGAFLGEGIGVSLDNQKYGIGSEESIKKMKEIAESIGTEASQVISENTSMTELGEEYISLSEKVALTNEEKERLIEINNQLVQNYPELAGVYDEEIGTNKIIISQLQEKIKLKKQESALAGTESQIATSNANIGDIVKKQTDKRQKDYDEIMDTLYAYQAYGVYQQKDFEYDKTTGRYNRENATISAGPSDERFNELQNKLKDISYVDYTGSGEGFDSKRITLDLSKITEQNFDNYKDAILEFTQELDNQFQTNIGEQLQVPLNDWTAGFDEQEAQIKAEFDKIAQSVGDSLDAAFTGIDSSSFASQNRNLIGKQLEYLFSPEEIQALAVNINGATGEIMDKTEEEIKQSAKIIEERRAEVSSEMITTLNKLSKKEQEAYITSFNMIGAFRKDGQVDKNEIKDYLMSTLGDSYSEVWELIDSIPDAYIQELSKKYDTLITKNQDFINKLAESGKELEAYQFANIAMQIGEESPAYIQAFQEEYEKLINSSNLSQEQIRAVVNEIGKTNISSANSMAKLSTALIKIGMDEKDVSNLTNSMGSIFNRTGLTATDALSDIEAQLESVNSLIDILGANLEGSLSLAQIEKMNSLLQDMGQELIKNSQIVATGDGFKFTGDAGGIIGSGLQGTQDYFIQMAEESKQAAMYKRELMDIAQTQEEKNQLEQEAIELEKTSNYYLYAEADIRAKQMKASAEAADKEKQRLYDLIQKYKDMIAEMNRYYNLQRTILQLQNTQKSLDLDFQLASNSGEAGQIAKNQIFNLAEQQAALEQAKQIYDRDLKELGDFVNDKYGKYLTVDASGNIFQNTDALVNLAKSMEGASEGEAEQLQKLWDEIEEVRGAYEDLYDSAISSSNEYKQNLIEQQKLESQLRQYQINLEKTLRDMIIKEMQAEVKATQDKYNKIKQEDQKYLSSLQKNINKRKQLQSDQDQDKQIETLQNRIGLLSRDTSGIYTKELEDLQAELDQLLQEKSNTALDRLYEEEEAKTQKVSDELTLRSEYLQSQLDYELETYAISNQKVAELLEMKDSEILAWMTQHSEDFRRATTTEQENFIVTWTKQINEGKSAQAALTEDVEVQKKAIIEKFKEIETGGINQYIAAINKASNTPLVVKTDTSAIKAAIKEIEVLETTYDNFAKKQAQADLDNLLIQIEDAAAIGNDELVEELRGKYKRRLGLFESKGGNVKSANTAGISSSITGSAYGYNIADYYAMRAGETTKGASDDKDIDTAITPIASGTQFELKNRDGETAYYFNENKQKIVGEKNDWGIKTTEKTIRMVNGVRTQKAKDENNKIVYVPIKFMNKYPWDTGWHYNSYATGGMVDYTGPAWVDGTKTRPEAFLSAADTANIAKLRDILSKVFDSNSSSSNTPEQNQNTGDTYYEFHINVDELSEDYSAKDMMADMEKYIIQKSNYRNVINIGKRK